MADSIPYPQAPQYTPPNPLQGGSPTNVYGGPAFAQTGYGNYMQPLAPTTPTGLGQIY